MPQSADAVSDSLKLYFVNVGGYCSEALPEAHEFGLFVAETAAEAKQKALARLLPYHHTQHKDNLKDKRRGQHLAAQQPFARLAHRAHPQPTRHARPHRLSRLPSHLI